MWFNSLGLVLLLQSVVFANAAFERCNYIYNIDATRSVVLNSPKYPYKYDSGTSCKYTFQAPDEYEVYIDCNITLDKGSACTTEYFYVSQDADPNLRGASQYCGSGNIKLVSEYNKLSFAYDSTSQQNSGAGGIFSCRVTARLQVCDCGWSLRGRIVGGSVARPSEFPSMVGLSVNGNVVCGGSIINHKTILTAAHCAKLYPNASQYTILAGDYDVSSNTESAYARPYGVKTIIVHSNYNSNGEFNDIALLITSESIQWSRGVGPICLPQDTTSTFDYDYVDVVGFGSTMFGGARSNIMKKATVRIIPNSACQSNYPSLQSSQMCTFEKGNDACQFDSGGPAVMRRPVRQYQGGIISYGRDCGGAYPGVNLRVTFYIDWIKQNAVGPICFKPYQ